LDVATVKDRIESFGVPHTEVDLILVNGQSVDFAYRVQDGDRISVYPVFEAFDIAGLARLRPGSVMYGSYSMCISAAGRIPADVGIRHSLSEPLRRRLPGGGLASRTADSVDPRCGPPQTRLGDARVLPAGNPTAAATRGKWSGVLIWDVWQSPSRDVCDATRCWLRQ
jgi:hypothetical protein